MKGKTTRKRVGRVINMLLMEDTMKSDKEDYALIADIIMHIAEKEYMSAARARDILEDAKAIIPYISELRLL